VKCGAEVFEGYNFCMKCGSKIEVTTLDVNDASVEVPKKKKKLLLLIFAIIIVIALIGAIIYYMKYTKERSGLYNDIAWGTSLDKVGEMLGKYKVEKGKSFTSISCMISDYEGKEDIKAEFNYDFDDGGLFRVGMLLFIGNDSPYTALKLIKEYSDKFDKLYGDYEENNESYIWYTKKSKILLVQFSDRFVIVQYEDINKIDD